MMRCTFRRAFYTNLQRCYQICRVHLRTQHESEHTCNAGWVCWFTLFSRKSPQFVPLTVREYCEFVVCSSFEKERQDEQVIGDLANGVRLEVCRDFLARETPAISVNICPSQTCMEARNVIANDGCSSHFSVNEFFFR